MIKEEKEKEKVKCDKSSTCESICDHKNYHKKDRSCNTGTCCFYRTQGTVRSVLVECLSVEEKVKIREKRFNINLREVSF